MEQDENTILEQALNNDREGVLKALGTVEPWGRRHELLGLALADIAGNEPEEAIAIARQLGPPAQYSKVWEDLLGQLTVYPDGEELFLSIAAELPPSMLSETYYAQVFDTLANLDRERALALLVQIPHAAHRREAIDALSQKFSADEMDEAVAWAQGLPSASERDRALRNILANRNIIIPGGTINAGVERIALEPSGNFESLDDLRRTIITVPGSSELLYLEDLADVYRDYIDPPRAKVTTSGVPGLALAISMREGGNILTLGEQVRSGFRIK